MSQERRGIPADMDLIRLTSITLAVGVAVLANAQETDPTDGLAHAGATVTLPLDSQPDWLRPQVLDASLEIRSGQPLVTLSVPVYVPESATRLSVITQDESDASDDRTRPLKSFEPAKLFITWSIPERRNLKC